MDNRPTTCSCRQRFTEAGSRYPRTQQDMKLLRDWFAAPTDDAEALTRTGHLRLGSSTSGGVAVAVSGSKRRPTARQRGVSGAGAFRVDPYWFAGATRTDRSTSYAGLWSLLRESGIPFRVHWGKFPPRRLRSMRRGSADLGRLPSVAPQLYPRWRRVNSTALGAERGPRNKHLPQRTTGGERFRACGATSRGTAADRRPGHAGTLTPTARPRLAEVLVGSWVAEADPAARTLTRLR
jgi:hypothetical protein